MPTRQPKMHNSTSVCRKHTSINFWEKDKSPHAKEEQIVNSGATGKRSGEEEGSLAAHIVIT